MARNLRPVALDDLGLLSALRALVRDLSGRGGLAIDAHLPDQLSEMSPATELAVYRAVQEGLANVVRHAGAERACLSVGEPEPGILRLTIQDDGAGYPDRVLSGELRHSSGLAGMRERIAAIGGTVKLGASPSGGASLEVKVELHRETERA